MAALPSPTRNWHDATYPSLSPTRPELSAKHKTVLITGGGTGIGAETARYFTAAGASRIAVLGRREQPLLDTKASIETQFPNVDVFTAPTDVTNQSEVDAAFAHFLGDGQELDVLVSGAAVIGPLEPLRDVDPKRFLDALQANVKGTLFVAQAFLRHAAANAVVVEINSSAAHVNFIPGFTSYSAAKLTVYRIWDSLAFENQDLSVFHIHPGVVDTDMNREAGVSKATGIEDHGGWHAGYRFLCGILS